MNIASKVSILDELDLDFQTTQVASFKEGILSYYYSEAKRPFLAPDYFLSNKIQYYFSMHSGQKITNLEVVDDPVCINENPKIPIALKEWIAELKTESVHYFKVFDMRSGVEYFRRDGFENVIVFVDDQIYIQDLKYLDSEPKKISNLISKDALILDSDLSGLVYIKDQKFSYSEQFAKELRNYVTELSLIQQGEMEEIRGRIISDEKLVKLTENFYLKEIKNRFRPNELDQILERSHASEDDIQRFSIFLSKKGYLNGKEYLIIEVIHKQILQLAVRDLSDLFLHRNGSNFEQINDMDLMDCLNAYRKTDFFSFESEDHLVLFTCFLLKHEKITFSESNYLELTSNIQQLIYENGEEDYLNEYEEYLLSDTVETPQLTIDIIDQMDGYQFETFVADLFSRMGYRTEVTKSSGDYGLDVIARKKELSIGIQAKCYSGKVPNKAIQEAIAGIVYYRLDKGLVVTNSYFTKQAVSQAIGSNIELWDRNKLIEKLKAFY